MGDHNRGQPGGVDAFTTLAKTADLPPEFATAEVMAREPDTSIAWWRAFAVLAASARTEDWSGAARCDAALTGPAVRPPPARGPLAVELTVLRSLCHAQLSRPDPSADVGEVLAVLANAAGALHEVSRRAVGYDGPQLIEVREVDPSMVCQLLRIDADLAADLRTMVLALTPAQARPVEARRLLGLDDARLVREWAQDRLAGLVAALTEERTAWLRRRGDPGQAHSLATEALTFVLSLFDINLGLLTAGEMPSMASLGWSRGQRIALWRLVNTDAACAVRLLQLTGNPQFQEIAQILYDTAAALVREVDPARFRIADHNRSAIRDLRGPGHDAER